MRCDSAGVRPSRGAPSAMLPLLLPLLLDVLLSWFGGPVIGIVSQALSGLVVVHFGTRRGTHADESLR